jgi:hypothetical protein
MKTFLFVSLFLSAQVFAAEVHLNGGDSITLRANVETTVTCAGNGTSTNCSDVIDGLKVLVDACKSSYSASSCIDKYWPNFKQQNPSCVMAGMPYCIDQCKTSYSAASCADKCSR